MSFVVFADGTANLPASCQEGVTMLPCSYFVEGVEQEYLGDVDNFDGHAYYQQLASGCKITTSLLNTGLFLSHFRPVLEQGQDLVYVHVEAPDECGHRGETANKVRAIELIDGKILGPVRKALEAQGDYRILVLPDHPTPLAIRTHSSEPVPYLIYDSREKHPGVASFTESTARAAGNYEPDASVLMKSLIK